MKTLMLACTVLSLAALLPACPLSIFCTADRGAMHKVGDEYSGSVHFAIYEHQTSGGVTHRLYVRCEK